MDQFWRRLRRSDPLRVAALAIGVSWLVLFGAYAFAAVSVQPAGVSLVAAAGALLIAGAGILYAWREPGR